MVSHENDVGQRIIHKQESSLNKFAERSTEHKLSRQSAAEYGLTGPSGFGDISLGSQDSSPMLCELKQSQEEPLEKS